MTSCFTRVTHNPINEAQQLYKIRNDLFMDTLASINSDCHSCLINMRTS